MNLILERLISKFGHTFGHAIEKTTNFRVPHGIAVLMEYKLHFFSKKFGLLKNSKFIAMTKNIKR